MRTLIRFLFTVAVVGLVILGGAWWWAGRMDGPAVDLKTPQKFIGRATALEMSVQAPGGQFSRVDVTLEQNGTDLPGVHARAAGAVPGAAGDGRTALRDAPDGQAGDPRTQVGTARLDGARRAPGALRLEARRVDGRPATWTCGWSHRGSPLLSTFHYVNHGGSEFVVYRVTPEDVVSGVRVGDKEYPGFPAKGAGITARPGAARGVLRPAVRSGPEYADSAVRARRGGQRGHDRAGSSGLPEAVREEPHRIERRVPAARGAGDRGREPRRTASRRTTSSRAS